MDIQQHNRFQKLYIDDFYLLDIENNSTYVVFKIVGSTNNVYSVKIYKKYNDNIISCDCPDMKKWCRMYNVLCKHILFIVFKVLKLFKIKNSLSHITVCDKGMSFLEKKTLNTDYIEVIEVFTEMFNFTESSENFNVYLRQKYSELSNKQVVSNLVVDSSATCLICFDDLKNNTIKCSQCVGTFHKECVIKWTKYNNTCPYCRLPNFVDTHVEGRYLKLI